MCVGGWGDLFIGTPALVTQMTATDSISLDGFPLTSFLAMGKEVKLNLPNGIQMAKSDRQEAGHVLNNR